MNDLILAAMHEQSEFVIFTDLREPFRWIPVDETLWGIKFTNIYPTAEADTGYIFS